MMELTGVHLVSIVLGVVLLAVAAVAVTVTALFNSLNAKGEAFTNSLAAATARLEAAITRVSGDLAAYQQVMDARVEAIQAAVAAGAEEHKTWHAALEKTNARLDREHQAWQARFDQRHEAWQARFDQQQEAWQAAQDKIHVRLDQQHQAWQARLDQQHQTWQAEHQAWRAEHQAREATLEKTNARLDQLLMHLLETKD